MMWYYVRNNQRIGPVDENALENLIQNGTVVRQTLVWKEGMGDWKQACETELAENFSGIAPIPPTGFGVTAYSDISIRFQPDSLRNLWLWFVWLTAIGTVLTFFMIGIPILIAGVVIQYILLYRFWLLIQDGKARTSPGKAVGFCFIPIFNLYWFYVAIVGLSQDMNLYCNERNIAAPRVNESLALTLYIITLLTIIPYVGLLAIIPATIIHIILFKQFVDAATAIMEFKAKGSNTQNVVDAGVVNQ